MFAARGCSVAIHYNSPSSRDKASQLIAELTQCPGVRAAAFQADLSSYDATRAFYAEVVKDLGNPNILLSNHGVTGPRIGPEGDIADVSPEAFEETWRTNAGTHFLVRRVPPTWYRK